MGNKKVLVVDDTKNIRMLLRKCLELEGYEVETANDGRQALELFKSKRYDLAFLDIKLPEISGTEVLKNIRELGVPTPVIIITAYATVKNAVECTRMGAVAYLQKPFTGDKVKTVLNELICDTQLCDAQQDDADESIGKLISEARSLISNHSYAQAVGKLKTAISKDIDNAEIYRLLGKAYEGLGDMENAKKFHKAYELFL